MFSMPFLSVAVDEGQPAQEPRRCRNTVPDPPSKPLKTISPPSPATAGRTRVSSNSLIWDTISESPSSKDSSSSPSAAALSIRGRPRVKCSMIAPRTAGFRCRQSPSDLVTEMKSEPKKTLPTSGMPKRAAASGERAAASLSGKSATALSPITSRPGRNFSVAGFGVDSVWMNIAFPSG